MTEQLSYTDENRDMEEKYTNEGSDRCPEKDCNGILLVSYVSDVYGFNKTWVCDKCGTTWSE